MASSSSCGSGGDGGINSVANIIKVNFSLLDLNSKIEIKRLGRPTPVLKLNQTCRKKKKVGLSPGISPATFTIETNGYVDVMSGTPFFVFHACYSILQIWIRIGAA